MSEIPNEREFAKKSTPMVEMQAWALAVLLGSYWVITGGNIRFYGRQV